MRLLVLLSLVALTACRDECSAKTDPGHCEANTAVNCPTPGVDQLVPVRWSHQECDSRVCVESGSNALCVLDGGSSTFCTGADQACDGTTQVRCASGFETARSPCLSCDPDGGICNGGASSRCSSDTDCVSTLFCRDAGTASFCTKR